MVGSLVTWAFLHILLHQRSDNFQQRSHYPIDRVFVFDALHRDSAALPQRVLKVLLNLRNARNPIQVSGALKMMIQTAIVQVYRSYHGAAAVADEDPCGRATQPLHSEPGEAVQEKWILYHFIKV